MLSQMRSQLIAWTLLCSTVANAKVSTIWEFPVGYWAENLILRNNGYILTTIFSHPKLYQVDPSRQEPARLVTKIPHKTGLLGITETSTDIFYVTAGNMTFKPAYYGPGTYGIWAVDLRTFKGARPIPPTLIASFPKGGLLNGLVTLDSKKEILLIADSTKGVVRRLDVRTGAKDVVISDPLMKRIGGTGIGIDGLKLAGNYLYWTNNGMQIIVRVPISAYGTATGPAEIVANVTAPDDLIITGSKHNEAVGFVSTTGNGVQKFVGNVNHTYSNAKSLVGNTAVILAAQARTLECYELYASTCGGVPQYFMGNVTVPGRILKIAG